MAKLLFPGKSDKNILGYVLIKMKAAKMCKWHAQSA